jgi:hypothetical protein
MALAGTQPDVTAARGATIRREPALCDRGAGATTLADLRVYPYSPLLVVIILAPAAIVPPAVTPAASAPTPIPAPVIRVAVRGIAVERVRV